MAGSASRRLRGDPRELVDEHPSHRHLLLAGLPRLVETGDSHAVFENDAHDFPQRIRYARDGDTLTATISDMSGEQSFSFVWTRVTD